MREPGSLYSGCAVNHRFVRERLNFSKSTSAAGEFSVAGPSRRTKLLGRESHAMYDSMGWKWDQVRLGASAGGGEDQERRFQIQNGGRRSVRRAQRLAKAIQ